jgi:hypothetical protein
MLDAQSQQKKKKVPMEPSTGEQPEVAGAWDHKKALDMVNFGWNGTKESYRIKFLTGPTNEQIIDLKESVTDMLTTEYPCLCHKKKMCTGMCEDEWEESVLIGWSFEFKTSLKVMIVRLFNDGEMHVIFHIYPRV